MKPTLLILLTCFTLSACAGSNGSNSVASQERELKQMTEKMKSCDGQGTAFSGQLVGRIDMSENAAEAKKCALGFDVASMVDPSVRMDCTQKDAMFTCVGQQSKHVFEGCINQDGTFAIQSDTSEQLASKLPYDKNKVNIKHASNVLSGDASEESSVGQVRMDIILQNPQDPKQHKNCKLRFELQELDLIPAG